MNVSSHTQSAIDPSTRVDNPALSKRTAIIWLLQLVFPTIALAHVVIWVLDPFLLGQFGKAVLLLSLLWFAGCFLVLAFRGGRRWVATHPALLLVFYLLFTAGLVAAEIASRSAPLVAHDPRLPHITQLSRELGWQMRPGAEDITQDGWRRPFYPREKGPGHFRIFCLGDSTTFGVGCTWSDAWPHQLEVLLNRDADWSRTHGVTEVINMGVLMYGPDQSLLALKYDGLSYSPDLVIYHMCIDDFVEASFDHYWKINIDRKMYKPFFVLKEGRLELAREHASPNTDAGGKPLKSYETILPDAQLRIFSFLRTRARSLLSNQAPRSKQPELTKAHWPVHDSFHDEYAAARPLVWALIKEMSKLSNEAGARFVLTLSPHHLFSDQDPPPWRVASFLHEYQEDAKAAGIPALDCVPEFFRAGQNGRFQLDGLAYHLNAEGNAFIAAKTFEWLKQQGGAERLGQQQ